MNMDPRDILAREKMGRFQVMAVAICILLNALDGFDVLSVSFAAPGIAREWGIDRAGLGIVLSMELIGMAVGSVLLGNIADRIGRRPAILACLAVMTVGMFLAATAGRVEVLSIYRLATGLGIGGMLAAVNAMAAEYSNAKHRSLAVMLMAAGYPAGAIVGGSVASVLLAYFDWRSVFLFGAVMTASFLPLIWYLLPESISYLSEKRPPNALERINATLRRMGHTVVSALPEVRRDAPRASVAELFSPGLARITILLAVAYFAHIMTFYFILKWVPKIVVDMGFAASLAGTVLVWANVGGVIGSVGLGLLTHRFSLRPLLIVTLLLASVMVTVFGQGQANLTQLSLAAGIAGIFTNGGVTGLYALFAQSFPTKVRAGGTGFVIGIGRGGAALGPIVAGFLFATGSGLATVALAMAAGSLIGAVALGFLRTPGPATEGRRGRG